MNRKNKKADGGKLRVLVTGFGAFPGNLVNPSGALAKILASRFKKHEHIHFRHLVLKTEFNSCYDDLRAAIDDFKPDLVIAFGLKARAKGFETESTARNQAGNHPDASGKIHEQNEINPKGEKTIRSTLPLRAIKRALDRKNIAVRTSKSAGDYVCNYLFYRLMQDIKHGDVKAVGGFVHIPYSKSLAANFQGTQMITPMDDKKMEDGAALIIETAAKYIPG